MDIQNRIKTLMKQLNWSEYRLAKESNLSQSTISNMFNRSTAPTFPTIEMVCDAFGITLSQFFAEADEAITLTEEQRLTLLLWGALSQEQKDIIKRTMIEFGKPNNNAH